MVDTIAVKDANEIERTVSTIDALIALVGEVQASPTSNTLLERLKSIKTALDTLHTDLATTLAGYVDGLETLLTTANTNLGTLHTDLATTLAGLATSLNGYVDQLEGYVDGLETLVTSTNTKLDSLITGTKDAGPSWTSAWGVSSAPVASSDMSSAANVTDAPTSGQKICIDDIILTNRTTGALECTLKCETTAAVLIGPLQLPGNSSLQITPRGKLKLATADKKVTATWSAAGNVNVLIGYHSET